MGIESPNPDRYEIIGELGHGGMSVVYRAKDRQLGREVALKVLHDFLARQEDARKRFHREAVAVARLHDPGILEIFDYSGPDARRAYIVTELIDGHTLRTKIETAGGLRYPELGVLVATELVRALHHAHHSGIIHRDIKPENVMVGSDGQLKLMDFGIAQIMEGATKLTATGTLLGSPAHMAPEVIDGKPSDHRSDIFSVGTMLYWLTTGRLPFSAPNPSTLFRRILEGDYEPPQLLEPKIGNRLARIIDKSLEPDPDARYQDVSELLTDLQKELEEVDLTPPGFLARTLLKDPDGFARDKRDGIIEALTTSGRTALEAKNLGRAMDRFNRVLAMEPNHPEVTALMAQISRRQKLTRRGRQAAWLTAAATVFLLGGYGVSQVLEPPADAPPALETPPLPSGGPMAAAARPPAPRAILTAEAPAPVAEPPPSANPSAEKPAPERRAVVSLRPEPSSPTPRAAPEKKPTTSDSRSATPDEKPPAPKAPASEPTETKSPSGASKDDPAQQNDDPETTSNVPEDPAPDDPPPEEVAPKGTLRIKIGGGWANIRINGTVVQNGAYAGTFELPVGTHTVDVFRSDGRHRPRTIVVDAEGQVYETAPDGRQRALMGGELGFRMPRRGQTVDGWIPRNPENKP